MADATVRSGPSGVRSPTSTGFRSTAVATVAFGLGMGYLEAAVVVYLRVAIETGAAVAAHDPVTFGTFEAAELTRELATLVMIVAVGWLAGRSGLERLAWAAVVFGTWDIVYYVGLRLTIGWPPALDAWDILFLIPTPWVGPVWAPIVVSLALIGFGLTAAHRLRSGRPIPLQSIHAMAALAGGGLVIASFLVDTSRVLVGGETSAWTGWPLFWAGMALATASTAHVLVTRPSETRDSPASRNGLSLPPEADAADRLDRSKAKEMPNPQDQLR